jgi:hypothetical protein
MRYRQIYTVSFWVDSEYAHCKYMFEELPHFAYSVKAHSFSQPTWQRPTVSFGVLGLETQFHLAKAHSIILHTWRERQIKYIMSSG